MEAFEKLNLEDLRPLGGLVASDPPKRKTELVPLLAGVMTNAGRVRGLYDQLDATSQRAVRMAAFDDAGELDHERFEARFGDVLRFDNLEPGRDRRSLSYQEQRKIRSTTLRLFFPDLNYLPTETCKLLLEFVPELEAFELPTIDAPPAIFRRDESSSAENPEEDEQSVQVRETAAAAEADLRAMLRLIEAGKVRVTDKKHVPTEATRRAIAAALFNGDFYSPDDADESKYDPAYDMSMRSFAWPVLIQAAKLADKRGDALKLTATGKKALTSPPRDLLRTIWEAWLKTSAFDEFARVDAIKGQGSADLTKPASRRALLVEALTDCPAGKWFSIDNFFRLMRTGEEPLTVAEDEYKLYLVEHQYGHFGYEDEHAWEQIEGRYVLAFLFEYAATLGVVDVAYVLPEGVRNDFGGRWGTDDFSCLSRYDGLLYLRVNPLGAWLLGEAGEYRPVAPRRVDVLRVLAHLDVIAAHGVSAADRMALERFADPTSENVWRLSSAKALHVVEQGGSLDELQQLLTTRTTEELPGTVVQFLADMRAKAGRLVDAGPARLIACADEHVAAELAADPRLKGKCLRTRDRFIAVREADLAAVKKTVRKLGYVWPVAGD